MTDTRIAITLAALVIITGCTTTTKTQQAMDVPVIPEIQEETNITEETPEETEPEAPEEAAKEPPATIKLLQEGAFTTDECDARGLTGQTIMLESPFCGYCKATKPDFIAAAEATNTTPKIIDIATKEGWTAMEGYGVMIQYTPTFIVNCHYYVGGKDLETYIDWMGEEPSES